MVRDHDLDGLHHCSEKVDEAAAAFFVLFWVVIGCTASTRLEAATRSAVNKILLAV